MSHSRVSVLELVADVVLVLRIGPTEEVAPHVIGHWQKLGGSKQRLNSLADGQTFTDGIRSLGHAHWSCSFIAYPPTRLPAYQAGLSFHVQQEDIGG